MRYQNDEHGVSQRSVDDDAFYVGYKSQASQFGQTVKDLEEGIKEASKQYNVSMHAFNEARKGALDATKVNDWLKN